MSRRYPKEMIEFVKEHGQEGTIEEMAERVRQEFGIDIGYPAMKSFFSNHKIHAAPRKGRTRPEKRITTPEMDAFIQENYIGTGHKAMADMVNEKFGTSFTKEQMKAYYARNKLNSGLTGRFDKGHEPWTKGTHWDEYMSPEAQEHSRQTCFEHAHIPDNHLPVGTVRKTKDGYLIKKVKERGYQWDRWKLLHRLVWEEHNGPVPEGKIVGFRDGNKENCDIDNLVLMTMGENAVMNKRGYRSTGNVEIADAGLTLVRLEAAIKSKKKRRKTTK